MKRRSRLRGRTDFQRLLAGRRLYSGESLVGFAAEGRTAATRIGVAASRKIRGSVARNRVRRRLREAARQSLLADGSIGHRPGISFDVVLIARPSALNVAFGRLLAELDEFAIRLQRLLPTGS